MLPPIKGFVPSSMLDWEGKIASVVFLPGCNFRCGYCHAGALVASPEELETIPNEIVMEHLAENEGWIDGIVISGGEPTLHDGLTDLCEQYRKAGAGVKLDTNGSRPETVEHLINSGLVDFVSMDVKAPFDERYLVATGIECEPDAIRRSAEAVIVSGIEHEFRTTVCPTVSSRRDILDIARSLDGAKAYVLQPFRPVGCLDKAFEDIEPLRLPELREWAKAAAQFVPGCRVRGE